MIPALVKWDRRMESLRLAWATQWVQVSASPCVWYLTQDREEEKKKGGKGNLGALNEGSVWLVTELSQKQPYSDVVVQGLECPGRGQQLSSEVVSTCPKHVALLNSILLEKRVNHTSKGAWPVNWYVRNNIAAILEMVSLIPSFTCWEMVIWNDIVIVMPLKNKCIKQMQE